MGKILNDPYSFIIAIIDSRFTPLWFVRDLMCFCMFSPLILFIVKRLWLAIVVLALSIFVTCYWEFSHQNVITWIPIYLLGAIVGRYLTYKESEYDGSTLRELIKSVKLRRFISVILFIFWIFLYILSVDDNAYLYQYRLFSPLILWVLIDFVLYRYIKTQFKKTKWMGYTFFIYCTHFFVLNVFQKLTTIFIEPTNLALNMIFIISPFLTIILLTYLASLLSRYSFYKYLSGKR